jgi:hypothetical protein
MAEMDTGFDQFLGQDVRHAFTLSLGVWVRLDFEHRKLSAFLGGCQRISGAAVVAEAGRTRRARPQGREA